MDHEGTVHLKRRRHERDSLRHSARRHRREKEGAQPAHRDHHQIHEQPLVRPTALEAFPTAQNYHEAPLILQHTPDTPRGASASDDPSEDHHAAPQVILQQSPGWEASVVRPETRNNFHSPQHYYDTPPIQLEARSAFDFAQPNHETSPIRQRARTFGAQDAILRRAPDREIPGRPETRSGFNFAQHHYDRPIRQHAPNTPSVQSEVPDAFDFTQPYRETSLIRQHTPEPLFIPPGARDTVPQQAPGWEIPVRPEARDAFDSAWPYRGTSPVRQHAPQSPVIQPEARDAFDFARSYRERPPIRQHALEPPLLPHGDTFHLLQRHHEIPVLQPYTHGSFANAHDFIMINPVFNDEGTYVNYPEESELDLLRQFISEDALHDSSARFPPPRCHPGTRESVLRKIYGWISEVAPRQRILWLNGPAGAGKTAVAQTVAEYSNEKQLAASFFFKRSTKDRGVMDRLFLTLTWQLATSIPETCPYIESALKADRLLHKKSIDVQFDHLFVKVFQKLLHDKPDLRLEKTLIVIDGIDECSPERDQGHFLKLIGDAMASGTIPLRFLLCSRAEFQIQETFDMEKIGDMILPIVLDNTVAPDEDIRRYLEDQFLDIFTKRKVSLPTNADIDYLVLKASGQFIYASTVVKFVDDDNCNPKEQLAIILNSLKRRQVSLSSPYALLDELYIQVLSQQSDTRLLRDVFVLIIAFGCPNWSFICRRLQERKEDLKIKLRRLSSLLQISDSGVETYHQSLHDFFLDKSRAGRYYIHPMRVALVRLPRNSRRFVDKISVVRSEVGILRIVLVAGRLLLAPLFVVPGVCIGLFCGCSGRWQFNPTFLYVTFLCPIG